MPNQIAATAAVDISAETIHETIDFRKGGKKWQKAADEKQQI